MNEIKKYLRTKKIINLILGCFSLTSLVYLLITVIINDDFEKDTIVALLINIFMVIVIIVCFVYLDKKRTKLIHKYYGKPNDIEITKAKELFKMCKKILKKADYDFLSGSEYEGLDTQIYSLLSQLSKGFKVNCESIKVLDDLLLEINNYKMNETENDLIFKQFIIDLKLILVNNTSDL